MDSTAVKADLAHVLYTKEEIQARVAELAAQIDKDYEGRDILVVGVLKGAVMIMADLVRALKSPFSRLRPYNASGCPLLPASAKGARAGRCLHPTRGLTLNASACYPSARPGGGPAGHEERPLRDVRYGLSGTGLLDRRRDQRPDQTGVAERFVRGQGHVGQPHLEHIHRCALRQMLAPLTRLNLGRGRAM